MSDAAQDIILEAAWAGCIWWAASDKHVIAKFERDTGKKFPRGQRSGIERLVDDATGHNPFDEFVEWVTVELFGLESAPKAYREHLAKRAR